MPRDAEGVYTPRTYVNDGSMLAPSIVAAYNNGQITSDQAHNPGQTLQSVMANINSGNAPLQGILQGSYANGTSSSTPSNYSPATALQNAITGQSNNASMINNQYSSLIDALKSQIQQSINNKQQEKNNLGQIYDPQRATSEVQKANELRTSLEQSANMGDRGGIGRQNALNTQTEGDNRLNSINLAQTNQENNLKNDIANLTLEGNVQEAQLQAQKLKDLIANNQYEENMNYKKSRDAVADSQWQQNFNQQSAINAANIANTQANTQNQVTANDYQKKLLDQQVASGQISNDMAKAQYQEYSNPESVTNQLNKLGLDTAKLDYKLKDSTTQAQIDSILADLKSKNISNDVAQYQLNELNDPYSLTNQMKAIDIAQKDQDLTASKAQYEEWLQLAPQRIKQEQEQTLQATDAARLARLQVQVENEELLAKKIDTANLTQQQKDAHAQVLQDIANSKASIAARQRELGISSQQLQLERDKFNYSKGNSSSKQVSTTVSAAYSDYLKSNDKTSWLNANTKYMTDSELKEFMSLINKNPNE